MIKNIATDLSAAFIVSVLENAPCITHIFDFFHEIRMITAVYMIYGIWYAMWKSVE